MTQKYDFPRFKIEVSLVQYAAHLGYEIDKKKSTRLSIAMRSSADKIIISRRNNVWVYFSVSDDNDNGTIINFIENRTRKSLAEIGGELHGWLRCVDALPKPKNYMEAVEEQEYDLLRVEGIFGKCRAVKKHAYLESRGITTEVLTSPRFIGRVYEDHYNNVAFPHYNADNKVCGLELKSKDRAIFVRGSEKTLWRSNYLKNDNTLVIGEAVIDVLSYYMLFLSKTSVYAVTGGGVSQEQGRALKNAVGGFKSLKTIVLAMDNDLGGDRLSDKVRAIISETSFQGAIKRHSPRKIGGDWNDVLVE